MDRLRAQRLAAVIGIGILLAGCNSSSSDSASQDAITSVDVTSVDDSGSTSVNDADLRAWLSTITPGVLSVAEEAGILFMREEEKLARDVYLALGEQWGMNVFDNISSSEQT
ncbi:MAG: DUF2202 domain-containing protein, partial [Gammaproteobacteria bacterium]